MHPLIPALALMMTVSQSQAIEHKPNPVLDQSIHQSSQTYIHKSNQEAEIISNDILLVQGPRGPWDVPRDFRGPHRGPDRYAPHAPRSSRPFDPDFRYDPGPRPAPPPPDPGPAGIIPHVLPLLLPPPRP